MSSLMDKLKKAGSITASQVLSDSIYFNSKETIKTDLPILNIAFSGDVEGGLVSGVTIYAGQSKNFKCNSGETTLEVYTDE